MCRGRGEALRRGQHVQRPMRPLGAVVSHPPVDRGLRDRQRGERLPGQALRSQTAVEPLDLAGGRRRAGRGQQVLHAVLPAHPVEDHLGCRRVADPQNWGRYLPVTFVSVTAIIPRSGRSQVLEPEGPGRIPPNGASLMVAPTGDPQRYWGESRLRTGTQARRAPSGPNPAANSVGGREGTETRSFGDPALHARPLSRPMELAAPGCADAIYAGDTGSGDTVGQG